MTDMIERVAKAMAENDSGPMDSALFAIHWREFGEDYIDSARTAIAAMREPTDEMNDAGADKCDGGGCAEESCQFGFMGKIWTAMIDAALEETKSTTKGE